MKPVSRRHKNQKANMDCFPSPRRWFVSASEFIPWRIQNISQRAAPKTPKTSFLHDGVSGFRYTGWQLSDVDGSM